MSAQEKSEAEIIAAWKEKRAKIAAADAAARHVVAEVVDVVPITSAADDPVKDRPQETSAMSLLRQAQVEEMTEEDAQPEGKNPGATTRFRKMFGAIVVAPVLLVAFYLMFVATPLYEARSVIAITKTGDSNAGAKNGLLGGGERPSNLTEVFRADTYIESQALMDALEEQTGFVSELSGPAIDPIQRLRSMPLISISKHALFDRYVEASVDVQSGLLTLFVRAHTPEKALLVSETVLQNAETQVARLGQLAFEKRQSYAADMRLSAEEQVQDAHASLVDLQLTYQEVDPAKRIENIYVRIKELEDEAYRINSEIQRAQINGVGDSPQTERLVSLAKHVDAQILDERARLVSADGHSRTPLNDVLMQYERAVLSVDVAREAVKTAIKAEADSNREAALNQNIFQVVVPPSVPQVALYPNVFGTLILTLLLCCAVFGFVITIRGKMN